MKSEIRSGQIRKRFKPRALGIALFACLFVIPLQLAGGETSLASAEDPSCEYIGGDYVCAGKILIGPSQLGWNAGPSLHAGDLFCRQGLGHSPADGLETDWVKLPPEAGGHAARLDFTAPVGVDADLGVLFADDACNYMGAYGGMYQASRNRPELGFIPLGARYAQVFGVEGAEVSYTFKALTSQPKVVPESPAHAILEEAKPFEAEAADGVRLRGHIYKPAGNALATVLVMLPYWNSVSGATRVLYGPTDAQDQAGTYFRSYLRFLADAGFAVALVNLRGSGISDGTCWHWGDDTDISDVRTVIEALAKLPWSNGSVGMYGHSFGGWSAYMGLASGAPSLRAIVPVSGVIDPWSVNSLHGVDQLPQTFHLGRTLYTGADSWARACDREVVLQEAEEHPPASGDRSPFWDRLDLRSKIKGSKVPTFAVNGLMPPLAAFYRGEPHILQVEGLWDLLEGDKRFLLGQWGHEIPSFDLPDYRWMVTSWFDHYLRGAPQTVAPGIVQYQDDSRAWHSSNKWPPAEADERWLLSGTELLKQKRDIRSSARSFVGIGSPCLRLCVDEFDRPGGGPATTPRIPTPPACIPNNVAYVSRELKEDIHLAGNFRLDLRMSSNLSDGNIYAYLIETDSDGCSDRDSRIVGRAPAGLRQIKTEYGMPFPTDRPLDVTIVSLPFAAKVQSGKRLAIAIGGDGAEGLLMPDHLRPVITIHTGDGAPSALRLPVVGAK